MPEFGASERARFRRRQPALRKPLRQFFFPLGQTPPEVVQIHARIARLGEHAVVALFLLVNVMQDLFGKHFHLCIVEFVSVMQRLSAELRGKADLKHVSQLVRELLDA